MARYRWKLKLFHWFRGNSKRKPGGSLADFARGTVGGPVGGAHANHRYRTRPTVVLVLFPIYFDLSLLNRGRSVSLFPIGRGPRSSYNTPCESDPASGTDRRPDRVQRTSAVAERHFHRPPPRPSRSAPRRTARPRNGLTQLFAGRSPSPPGGQYFRNHNNTEKKKKKKKTKPPGVIIIAVVIDNAFVVYTHDNNIVFFNRSGTRSRRSETLLSVHMSCGCEVRAKTGRAPSAGCRSLRFSRRGTRGGRRWSPGPARRVARRSTGKGERLGVARAGVSRPIGSGGRPGRRGLRGEEVGRADPSTLPAACAFESLRCRRTADRLVLTPTDCKSCRGGFWAWPPLVGEIFNFFSCYTITVKGI